MFLVRCLGLWTRKNFSKERDCGGAIEEARIGLFGRHEGFLHLARRQVGIYEASVRPQVAAKLLGLEERHDRVLWLTKC